MRKDIDTDIHYVGKFVFDNEEVMGEIIYNKKKGSIFLNVRKSLKNIFIGKLYGRIKVIKGEINTGAKVTLINNVCVQNYQKVTSYQDVVYRCEQLIWSKDELLDFKFNKMIVEVSNALYWTGLSNIMRELDERTLKFNSKKKIKEFDFLDSKILFYAAEETNAFLYGNIEEYKLNERLKIEIKTNEKKDSTYFIEIRNKILNLISFAIRDNVNIERQIFYRDDQYITQGEKKILKQYLFVSSEKYNNFVGTSINEYNFSFDQLVINTNVIKKLEKLEPIFHLYLSLFKYEDMPTEMVFLNIIQAVETFHARFFYNDSKKKYIKSLETRYGDFTDFELYKDLLLSSQQEETPFIILFSRINDLLIRAGDVFNEFNYLDGNLARKIVDTRNYYTHYPKNKQSSALKGNKLDEIIYQLNMILQYHVCAQLGIDSSYDVSDNIKKYYGLKDLDEF